MILSKIRLHIFLENKYFIQAHVTELKTEETAEDLKSVKIYVIGRVVLVISLSCKIDKTFQEHLCNGKAVSIGI